MGWRKEEALGGKLEEVDDAIKGGARALEEISAGDVVAASTCARGVV